MLEIDLTAKYDFSKDFIILCFMLLVSFAYGSCKYCMPVMHVRGTAAAWGACLSAAPRSVA